MNHLRAQWRAAINKRDYSPIVMWRGQTVELREPQRTQFLDAWNRGATRVMRDLALEAVVSNPVDHYEGAGGWWTEFRNEAELFGMTFNDNWDKKRLYLGMLMGAHLPKDFRNTNYPLGGSSWRLGTPIVIEKLFLSLPPPPDVYGRESWVEVPIPLMETTTALEHTKTLTGDQRYYHVTRHADEIMSSGLRPSIHGESGPGVYLAADKGYADDMASWDKNMRALEVTVHAGSGLKLLDRTKPGGEEEYRRITLGMPNSEYHHALKAAGYDGVHYLSPGNQYPETIIHDPSKLTVRT